MYMYYCSVSFLDKGIDIQSRCFVCERSLVCVDLTMRGVLKSGDLQKIVSSNLTIYAEKLRELICK